MTVSLKAFAFGGAGVVVVAILAIILVPGDSPVVIRGGSITFHSDSAWNATRSNCASADIDLCQYTSVNSYDTTQLRLRGLAGAGSASFSSVTNWSVTVYESADGSYMPSIDGVVIFPSDGSGNSAAASATGYVSMKPTGNGGFYPSTSKADKKYHHAGCQPGVTGHHCEELASISVTIGGKTTSYACEKSNGCRIDIGPKKLF